MDKIYSRKRIQIPKFHIFFKKGNKNDPDKAKIRKLLTVIIVITIAFTIFWKITNAISPIFDSMCIEKTKSITTIISNREATNIMKKYEYHDLITIYKDKNDNITMIQSNIFTINKIISDVGVIIQEEINNIEADEIDMRLGSLTGSKFFSGIGPKIPIKVATVGNLETDFVSGFYEAGINQTLHRLYLNVVCHLEILTPYKTIGSDITNQVILAENIIVGTVPSVYLNVDDKPE